MDIKKAVKVLISEKDTNKSILKAIEELSELQTALIQYINKPDQYKPGVIEEEIVDVIMNIKILKKIFPLYKKLVKKKENKLFNNKEFRGYLKEYKKKDNKSEI